MTTRKPTRPAAQVDLAPAAADPTRYVVQVGHTITDLACRQRVAGAVLTAAELPDVTLAHLVALGALAPEQSPGEE
jgi:hypothetical protein